jgi:hypothetical protein
MVGWAAIGAGDGFEGILVTVDAMHGYGIFNDYGDTQADVALRKIFVGLDLFDQGTKANGLG